jgi:RimJ/RimL family protein N-acetyltransferase
MTARNNHLGQPIGADVSGWAPALPPPRTAMEGRRCVVEPLDPDRHAAPLFDAYAEDAEGRIWTYMACGPFSSLANFRAWISATCLGDDPLFHAIVDRSTGHALGVAAYLRIVPAVGVIEVGNIAYAPRLQRTAMATEAMFLMMRRAFDELGYRRYEWKCDALNAASCRAAERLGFTFEGVFRQATIYKGRNRDTAWYAIVDRDWPTIRLAYEAWLAPENFDPNGGQRTGLSALLLNGASRRI